MRRISHRLRKWLILGGLIGVPLFFAMIFILTRPNRYRPLPHLATVVAGFPKGSDGTVAVILPPADSAAFRTTLQLHFFLAQIIPSQRWRFTVVAPSLPSDFRNIARQQGRRHGWPITVFSPEDRRGAIYPPSTVWLIDRKGNVRGRYPLSSPLLNRRVREDLRALYYEYAHPEKFVP